MFYINNILSKQQNLNYKLSFSGSSIMNVITYCVYSECKILVVVY